MKFGIGLYPYDDGQPGKLIETARRAEELGLEGVFAFDHVLRAEISYRDAVIDPYTILTAVGAATERIKLGSNIIVLPIRQPLLVAKTLATMDYMFPGRMIAGIGTGWSPAEFAAVGVSMQERFDRMDEYSDALRALLHEPVASVNSRYVSLDSVELKPFPSSPIPIWVGSGSASPRPFDDPEKQAAHKLSRRGARRIARQDGWIVPSTATPELHRADWMRIRSEARGIGKEPEAITRVAYDFCHLTETENREEALLEQRKVFEQFYGYTKTWEFVLQHNLVGTVDDIARRMVDRVNAIGVSWWIIHLLTPDPDQINGWVDTLLPRFQAHLSESEGYIPPDDQ